MKRDPIKTPFLSKAKDSDYEESLAIFKLILRFMNDERLGGIKEKVIQIMALYQSSDNCCSTIDIFSGFVRLHREQGTLQRQVAGRDLLPAGEPDVEERERGELRAWLDPHVQLPERLRTLQNAPQVLAQVRQRPRLQRIQGPLPTQTHQSR